jgi:hypothetical protein
MTLEDPRIARLRQESESRSCNPNYAATNHAQNIATLIVAYDEQRRQIDSALEILFAASMPLGISDQQFNAQIILRSRDALTATTEHGPDWTDWQQGDDGDSCKCGFSGTSEECARNQALTTTTEQRETKPTCTEFRWLGQPFSFCDRCGKPFWDHTTYRNRAITGDEKAAVKKKWDRS